MSNSPSTHGCAALLHRLRSGEPGAMEETMAMFGQSLLEFIDRIVGDRWAAEDVLQDVFLRLFLSCRGVQAPRNLRRWLRRVARNMALSHVRDHRTIVGPWHGRPGTPPAPSQRIESRETRGEIVRAVARLDEPFRTTFTLCAVEGMECATAARLLDCPESTIHSRMSRSRRRLRAMANVTACRM